MSHLHERKEKVCLNCGAALTGRYCPDCGQENVEPKETTWHLVVHFFNDVTHFDGKLFSSLKFLLFKPGFLTEEYIKGRRASYLNPIRMYLFISALFFLAFVSFFLPKQEVVKVTENKKRTDTSAFKKLTHGMREIATALDTAETDGDNDVIVFTNGTSTTRKELNNFYPKTQEQYDSMQQVLPEEERDGMLGRYISKKMFKTQHLSEGNKEEFQHRITARFFHSLPYMLFISLPLIALVLQLLYIRRRQFYYVSHGIFAIHYYCLVFIGLLAALVFRKIGGWADIVASLLELGIIAYLYAAMYRFYKQGWFKTFTKYILLLVISSSIISALALLFVFYAVLNVAE